MSPTPLIDQREQLVNDRLCGTFAEVQLPLERITRLHGLMVDLDPDHLRPGNGLFEPAAEPCQFHAGIRPVLDRHPLFRHAEVRDSGRGLHLIVWIDPAVELMTAADQRRWAGIVQAVQSTLPADPGMPGITAVTRPLGSCNSRTNRPVTTLHVGASVAPADVVEYVEECRFAAFRVVAGMLLGSLEVQPCPLCHKPNSRLSVLDRVGKCYGGQCRTVRLPQLLNLIYAPYPTPPAADGCIAASAPAPQEM